MSTQSPAPVTIETLETPAAAAAVSREAEEAGMLPRVKSAIETVVGIGTIVYALGYLSWALYSWDRGFGQPPALEGQYLIAGIVPATLIGLCVGAFVFLGKLRNHLRRGPTEKQKQVGRWMYSIATGIIVVGFAVTWLAKARGLGFTLVATGAALSLASAFLSGKDYDRFFARGMTWYLFFFAPVFALALFQIFVTRVFPLLPAEFGGPASQTVSLDLKREELSNQTLQRLAPGASAEDDVVRSSELRLVLAPGDFYVVLFDDGTEPAHVKIRADAVRAIVPAARKVAPK